ncbi:MAG TPA: hypothetical protein VJ570_04210 [Holophagaceae bacterium]|nr:hypothetical protein [Holophagaceae bacterium]
MATPVFSLHSEILTDAPLALLSARLADPASMACLRPFGPWSTSAEGEWLQLTWQRRRLGSEEFGLLTISPHERGAHLQLEARHRGWTSFASFGILRWKTDQLLERLVEEL